MMHRCNVVKPKCLSMSVCTVRVVCNLVNDHIVQILSVVNLEFQHCMRDSGG